jgi:hypothetical protein
MDRQRKVVREMSWLTYPWGRIKEQIILYITQKMNIAENTACMQGLTIKTAHVETL